MEIDADDNVLPLLDISVRDGILVLRQSRAFKATRLRIVLQVWQVDTIAVAGSAALKAPALVAKTLALRASGSGVLRLDALTAETVALRLGGSGSVVIGGGQANALRAEMGGSAALDAKALQVRRAAVTVGGSAVASVWATDELTGSVGGSARLQHRGNAAVKAFRGGAGRLSKLPG